MMTYDIHIPARPMKCPGCGHKALIAHNQSSLCAKCLDIFLSLHVPKMIADPDNGESKQTVTYD